MNDKKRKLASEIAGIVLSCVLLATSILAATLARPGEKISLFLGVLLGIPCVLAITLLVIGSWFVLVAQIINNMKSWRTSKIEFTAYASALGLVLFGAAYCIALLASGDGKDVYGLLMIPMLIVLGGPVVKKRL